MKNSVYKIEIDDITIRCAEVGDAKAQKEAVDSSLEHLHEFMIWSHHEPESIEKKEERLKSWRKEYLKNEDFPVVVYRRDKFIAGAGLHTRLGDDVLEIGYWVRADELRKSVATKLSAALTLVAMDYIKVSQVEIRHNINNIYSSKVPLKLGYQRKENYMADDVENGRWIMNQELFSRTRENFKQFYSEIRFYDIDENML